LDGGVFLAGSRRKALQVGLLTFFLSISISLLFQITQATMVYWVSVVVLLVVILLGILFDAIGTAATAASEKPFHAMASDRVFGAKKAIELVRKADQVASFCNDVVGDICGTVSGSIGAALVIDFVMKKNILHFRNLFSIIVIGLISSLTVGGKAFGKSFAIKESNQVVLWVAVVLEKFEHLIRCGKKNKGNNKNKREKNKKT
jgi:CBS domain containing-hemolysin-like protein